MKGAIMIITIKPKKFSLYIANGMYSAAQVRAMTGADIVINGTLYTFATMQPCMDFKANGVVLSDDAAMYEGYGWNNNSAKMVRTVEMEKYDNFLSCCNIIKQGQDLSMDGIAWVAGARQRTGIGWTRDGKFMIYATQQNTTIAKMQQEMREAGCIDAINLDGGGSTQLSSVKYGNLYSSRYVQNYLCVWVDEEVQQPTTPPPTSVPANSSFWKTVPTDATDFPLVVRGTTNLNVRALGLSASRLVRTIPKLETFTVTGYANAFNKSWLKTSDGYVYRAYVESHNPYKMSTVELKQGSRGEGVKWMQWWLGVRGYIGLDHKILGCDGQFGPNTDYALRAFQAARGLKSDGICGQATRKALQT